MRALGCLALTLAALPFLASARNSTLGGPDARGPGCMEAVLGSDVPQEYADSVAQLFIGSAQGAYTPFLDCRGYDARAMEACYEDTDRGRDWVLDVAITCTEGRWGNGVSSIFVNGRLSVEGGNITVPAVPTLGVEMVVTEAADPGSPFAKRGQNVTADYWLHRVNGTLIESTEEGGPFAFVLGTGKVIRGWDEPIQLMHVGESAMLIVRPGFAYGTRTLDGLAPNSTLVFDVTVLSADDIE